MFYQILKTQLPLFQVKEGVGKSTIASNTAVGLAKKVLKLE